MRRKTAEERVRLGLYLKSQKDLLPHGQFLKFIEREIGCHPSTAELYMREAKQAIRVVEAMRSSYS